MPASRTAALSRIPAPGQITDLAHDNRPISASRVRIGARLASGEEIAEFRDLDLWRVDEVNGERVYYAPQAETFPFVFSR